MTPEGKTSVLVSVPADWNSPTFSPDGRYLALSVIDGKHFQIVVYDMQQNSLRQLTFDASNHVVPVWSPDSRRLLYASDAAQPGIQNLYWQRVDGVGGAQRLTTSAVSQVPSSIHPTGRFLAYNESSGKNLLDIRILPLNDDGEKGWTAGTSTLFVSTPGTDSAPAFSPDGRWLAYASNEEGTFSIYVRDYPGGTSKWRISAEGGSHPRWSRTSQELFFSSADQILVVPYKVNGNSLQADRARLWSPLRYAARGPIRTYDVHPDGKRVVAHTPEQTIGSPDSVVFAFNFFEELRRRVP
jgi:Tol biopolymer transport system component